MGRMADARNRARRGESAPGQQPAVAAPPPAEELADVVFAEEPQAKPAAPAGPAALPASGLAEDILRQLEAAPEHGPGPDDGVSAAGGPRHSHWRSAAGSSARGKSGSAIRTKPMPR